MNNIPGSSPFNLVRSGDKLLEYDYNKKASVDQLLRRGKRVYGKHEVKCKVRILLPNNHPMLFARYRGIVNNILKQSGGSEKKLVKVTYIDPKTKTKWKIVKKSSFWRTLAKILKFFDIFNMIHLTNSPGIEEYKLVQKRNLWEWLIDETFHCKEIMRGYELPSESFSLRDDSAEKGLSFQDAFTKISTLAYQNYEHDFDGHDEGKSAAHIDSDWVIIMENGALRMIPKSKRNHYKKEALEALKACRDHYQNLYSQNKSESAQDLSYFNFDKMIQTFDRDQFAALTPEHVYRMNMNLTSVEAADVESLITKIAKLHEKASGTGMRDTPLANILAQSSDEEPVKFTAYEAHVLCRYVAAKSAITDLNSLTVGHFLQATNLLANEVHGEKPLDHIPSEALSNLIDMMIPRGETRENAYTGRKIQKPIEGAYTSADYRFYKPWVEQQELLQTYAELEKDEINDLYTGEVRPLSQEARLRRFDELAAFVIVRKHLFKPHPKGYRIGEIIPAPRAIDGTRRWYRLARVVASHEGLMHYYFDPVGSNSGLQTCIMAKSTSSVPYAFEEEGTVKNDLNPLNPPGYEGRRHVRGELEASRKEHTVPVWVAYQHAASLCLNKEDATNLDLEKAHHNLARAFAELHKENEKSARKKSLHELVREYDAELNDVTWATASLGDLITSLPLLTIFAGKKRKYDKLLAHYAHTMSAETMEHESAKQRELRQRREVNDAKALLRYFYQHAPRDSEGALLLKYQEFIDAVNDNILKPTVKMADTNEYIEKVHQSFVESSLTKGNLLRCADALRQHAQNIGEDVDSKKSNGVRIVGHSLGGALAGIEAFEMTAGTDRLPVPGSVVDVRMYDDPGMSHEDNVRQYAFMVEHKQVMKAIDAKVNVYYSHDYGDVAPACGTAHLSAMTPRVMNAIDKRLERLVYKCTEEEVDEIRQRVAAADKMLPSHPRELLKTAQGREILKEYFLHDIGDVYASVTELKEATHYALEQETADYPFKHGTRYEMTRREKTGIISTIERISNGKLDVNMSKNLRLLGLHVDRLFREEDEVGEVDDNEELKEYRLLRKKKEEGKQFSYHEKLKMAELSAKYDKCESEMRRITSRNKLRESLKDEAVKYIARCEVLESARRDGTKRIRNLKKIVNGVSKVIHPSQKEIDSAIDTLVAEVQRDMQEIEGLHAEIRRTEGEERKALVSKVKKLRAKTVKKHEDVLKIIKDHYNQELHDQSLQTLRRTIGGVRITYIDKNGLGHLSGADDSDKRFTSKVWGLGVFHPKRTELFRRHLGRHVVPYVKKAKFNEANRDRMMEKKGHDLALTARDSKYKSLIVE